MQLSRYSGVTLVGSNEESHNETFDRKEVSKVMK